MENSYNHRIARELHDGIAQDLVALGYAVDLILAKPDTPAVTRSDIRSLRFSIDDLLTKVRREIFQLRNPQEGEISIILERLVNDICGELKGLVNLEEIEITEIQGDLIVNVARELLRNCVKHSGGNRIDLSLRRANNQIVLEISDNGSGGAHISSTQFGLRGVAERLEAVDGELEIFSDDSGTRITVRI